MRCLLYLGLRWLAEAFGWQLFRRQLLIIRVIAVPQNRLRLLYRLLRSLHDSLVLAHKLVALARRGIFFPFLAGESLPVIGLTLIQSHGCWRCRVRGLVNCIRLRMAVEILCIVLECFI